MCVLCCLRLLSILKLAAAAAHTRNFFFSFVRFTPLSSIQWRDIYHALEYLNFFLHLPLLYPCRTSHVVASGKGPTIFLSLFILLLLLSFLGAHLSIRCCFDNETWFECETEMFIWRCFIFSLIFCVCQWSHLCNFTRQNFWLRDKRNILFNFHARVLRRSMQTVIYFSRWKISLRGGFFSNKKKEGKTWIYIKENLYEFPWLRFLCLALSFILFEFFSLILRRREERTNAETKMVIFYGRSSFKLSTLFVENENSFNLNFLSTSFSFFFGLPRQRRRSLRFNSQGALVKIFKCTVWFLSYLFSQSVLFREFLIDKNYGFN